MKRTLLIFVCFLACMESGNSQNFTNATTLGKHKCTFTMYENIDPSGNLFIQIQIGGPSARFTAGGITFSSIYSEPNILKFSPSGNLLWYKQIDHNQDDLIGDGIMCVDGEGNCYQAGIFGYNLTVDTITIHKRTTDLYLIKMDPDGKILYLKDYPANTNVFLIQSFTDKQNNVYLSGPFQDTIHFGTLTLIHPSYNDPNNMGTFLVKISKAGKELWAKEIKTPDNYPFSPTIVSNDPSGNIYLLAQSAYNSTPGVPGVMKYDSLGNFIYFHYTDRDPSAAIGDNYGSYYISYYDNMNNAIKLVKYDNNGKELWHYSKASVPKSDTTNFTNTVNDLEFDENGYIYLTGLLVGDFKVGNTNVIHNGYPALYVAKLSPAGDLAWEQYAQNAMGLKILLRNYDCVVLGQYFASSNLGTTTLPFTTNAYGNNFVTTLTNSPLAGINPGKEYPVTDHFYPNPCQGILHYMRTSSVSGIQKVEIFDIEGRLMDSREIKDSEIMIDWDLSPLKNGVYFIKNTSANNSYIEKIIVYK